MSDIKLVPDENLCLVIHPASKTIAPKYKRQKAIHVAKGDHDSVLIAFEMPRYVNGYDMSAEENSIQIHYVNISCEDTTKHSAGFDKAEDITVKDDIVSFCWRVSANATKYAGTLSIGITFERYEEIEEEVREIYSWSTAPYGKIIVCDSMDSTEEAIESAYSYLIETCDGIVTTMLQEAIDSGKLDGIDGETPYIGENGNWFIGEYDTGVKANWASNIGTIESTLRSHDAFISILPTDEYGEPVNLQTLLPKTAPGKYEKVARQYDLDVLKETAEYLEGVALPRIYYDTINNKDFIKSSINYAEGATSNKTYVGIYENQTEDGTATFSNVPCKSGILFHYQPGLIFSPYVAQVLYGCNGYIYTRTLNADTGKLSDWVEDSTEEDLADLDERVTLLGEEVEELEKSTLPRIYYDTINDKDFIKSSINYVAGNTSNKTYVGMYENRKEDGSATFSNVPCKSGILFHYQPGLIFSPYVAQVLYGCNGYIYTRTLNADTGKLSDWVEDSTEEDLADLDERVTLLGEEVGNISTALDELHTYAQALIGGEA